MEAESFSQPPVRIGDSVYWYHDPLTCAEPVLGWIVQRPGVSTVCILTFSPYAGFQEKPSVRHRDDPGLQENADWRQWGCWEYSPQTAQSKKLDGLMSQIASLTEQVALARKQNGGTKNG
jgi:hypothetical protein